MCRHMWITNFDECTARCVSSSMLMGKHVPRCASARQCFCCFCSIPLAMCVMCVLSNIQTASVITYWAVIKLTFVVTYGGFLENLHPLQINAVCICFYSFECFCVFCGCSKSNEKNILDRLRYGFFSYSQIHIAPDFAKITHFLLSVFGNCQWNYFYGLRYFSMELQSFQFLKSKWFPYLNLPTYCVIAWNWKKMLVICKNANRCLN